MAFQLQPPWGGQLSWTQTQGGPAPQHRGVEGLQQPLFRQQLAQQRPEVIPKHMQAPLETSKEEKGQGGNLSQRQESSQLSWVELVASELS